MSEHRFMFEDCEYVVSDGRRIFPAAGRPAAHGWAHVEAACAEVARLVADNRELQSALSASEATIAESANWLAERDRLRATAVRMQAALVVSEPWFDDNDRNAWFERWADRFYSATGFMAPGKDEPVGLNLPGEESRVKRGVCWKEWLDEQGALILKAVRDALADPDSQAAEAWLAEREKPLRARIALLDDLADDAAEVVAHLRAGYPEDAKLHGSETITARIRAAVDDLDGVEAERWLGAEKASAREEGRLAGRREVQEELRQEEEAVEADRLAHIDVFRAAEGLAPAPCLVADPPPSLADAKGPGGPLG